MSAGFNVTVGNQKVTIKAGQTIEDIKKKFGDEAGNIFDGVDTNNNGKLDESEVSTLRTNLENHDYDIETAEDGRTPRRAYNDAMQNLKGSYDADKLKGFFKAEDNDLHTVKKGETLFIIAKKELEKEGLPTDYRSVNNRIAQIANLNNINDVNNIEVGTKLITKLTDDAINKVKEKDGDSALALNNKSAQQIDGDDWTEKGSKRSTELKPADGANNSDEVGSGVDTNYKKQKTSVDGKKSSIEISKNGLNMGKGVPVDKDGNELKSFKDPKYKEGGYIMKYKNAKGEVMYQTVYGANSKTEMLRGVKITGASIEEVKNKEKALLDTIKKIKTAPQNETEEAKTKRNAENVATLKELITISGGNEQVAKNVASKLLDDKLIDRRTDDYKTLVQNLLLTRNGDIVGALVPKNGDKVNMGAVTYDRTAHETLAGMYKEIREKEKAGEKLSNDEINLRGVLENARYKSGFKISEEKHLRYDENGEICYNTKVGEYNYFATDEKLLDGFVAELKTADTDEKKSALFKKYANTKDKIFASCLFKRADILHATDNDLKTIINSNGMEVIRYLDSSKEYSDDIINTMNERIKKIYTSDRGNLENAKWLTLASKWIDKTNLSDEEKASAKAELAETYFEKTTTKDDDGNEQVEYKFNPKRRPTKDEIEGLCQVASNDMKKAIGNYVKLNDMGKGQYNEAIEDTTWKTNPLFENYNNMVDGMTDKKEVLDFIENKIATSKDWYIPFDKILEKFPNDKEIQDKLITYVDSNSIISDTNIVALAKAYMKDDGKGNYTIDKTKLPKGAEAVNILSALPDDCKSGEAEKLFKATLKEIGKNNLDELNNARSKNEKAVKARLAELVKTNMADNDFIQNVCQLDNMIIPYQALYEIKPATAKWNDTTKRVVFATIFNNRIIIKDKQKYLDGAVKSGLATKVATDRYAVGNNVFDTGWHIDTNKNGKGDDNEIMRIKMMSKAGHENGTKLYSQLRGVGSGDAEKMLKNEGDYKNFVTADNVVGLITGFNDKSPKEGVMQYIANEWATIPQTTCNIIPNKLMEKAKNKGLDGDKAYKELEAFVKNHNDSKNKYTKEDGKKLDNLIQNLYHLVLQNS